MRSFSFRAFAGMLALPALLAPASAQSQTEPAFSDEVQALRGEIQELREEVKLLQQQVAALTAQAGPSAAAPPSAPAPAPEAPPAGAPLATPAQSQNLMNPAISAVFQMVGNTSLLREDEANGFDLSEAEVAFQSVVDPYAKMDLFLSFPSSEHPEVEEATVSTLSLPASLQLKGGRFKNAFGKWNILHTHAFFTVDRPEALVNFFGEESLTTDGLSLSVLIPNPWDLYLESATEVGTARPGEAFNTSHHDLTALQRLSLFLNTTPNSTLELGLSGAWGKTGPSETLLQDIDAAGLSGTLEPRDTLDSSVAGMDVTFKWKPLQLNTYRSFLWQTEWLRSRRDVDVLTPALTLAHDTVSSPGGYSYLEWQFAKRWKGGLRYDLAGFPDSETARETAAAAVVRFVPSEFQELRFEIKQIWRNDSAALRFGGDTDDTRVYFEWIPVIGAHGAHKY
jgi:hypothetical protein